MNIKTKVSSEPNEIIERTIKTSVLIDAFWDRWQVHGMEQNDLLKIRKGMDSLEEWVIRWNKLAEEKEKEAIVRLKQHKNKEAESFFQTAGLYYNLIYWIFPDRTPEKEYWYRKCLEAFSRADSLSQVQSDYVEIDAKGYAGRIRIPRSPVGCVILIIPIDSSKEELYRYEGDFLNAGLATVCFDGPGQGQTFLYRGLIGTRKRWETFIDRIVEYTKNRFPKLPLYTFGTSLGGSWSLYASCHPSVDKSVAVSPAAALSKLNLPRYFLERMGCCCIVSDEESAIPDFDRLLFRSPVHVFHGQLDQMVAKADLLEIYAKLPPNKAWVEFPEEGHCCNFKLDEVRKRSIRWFLNDSTWEGK